ncbi:hypothetical protein BaRGS_00033056 [Batillaria attramentaria]|uniref:P2X purinoceptor 7-like n=1 Tax=Batillaria attramentaria TaxID=370345 RepID=A0ABD0JL28_9CAEN
MASDDNYSSDELHLSCSSSSFEEETEPVLRAAVIAPYMYEPSESESSDTDPCGEQSAADSTNEERLHTTAWCTCSNCGLMPTAKESVCCREIPHMKDRMTGLGNPDAASCICHHPGFKTVCLDVGCWTLPITSTGNNTRKLLLIRYRYTAYRQLVRFVWGYLGKDIRVTLPSCAVTASERDSPVQMLPTQATWNLR